MVNDLLLLLGGILIGVGSTLVALMGAFPLLIWLWRLKDARDAQGNQPGVLK